MLKCACRWTIRAYHAQRAAQAIRTVSLRTCHIQPAQVDLMSLACIDIHIAIAIFCMSSFNLYFLMPAMHPTDRVGMDREGQVLMNAALAPEDTRRVRVLALKR